MAELDSAVPRRSSDRARGLEMSEQSQEELPSNLPQAYQPPSLAKYRPPIPQVHPLGQETPSLGDYLRILARRKWLLIAVALTVLVIALLQVSTTTPTYSAKVTLQVDPEDAKVLPYEEIARSGTQRRLREYIWTQAEIVKTRGVARRVVQRLKLDEVPEFSAPTRRGLVLDLLSGITGALSRLAGSRNSGSQPEDASVREDGLISRLIGQVTVRALRNTRLIEVSCHSPSPELAADICNTLAEEFIEQHLKSKFDATTRATDFLRKQLDELKIRVEQSEESLIKYAQAKNIVNLNERGTINRKRLADLNDELTRAEAELIMQTARHEAGRSATSDAFPETLKGPRIRDLEVQIGGRESELTSLSERYGSEWPKVKEVSLDLGELRRQLELAKTQAIAGARSEYRLARERRERLSSAFNQQRQTVDRLNEDSIQYRYLKRDTDSNKELYDGLLQRLKEAGVAAGLKSSNIRVADQAVVPGAASAPRKARSAMLGLLLGVCLGLGTVFLAEALDNTIKTTDDVVQQLGLPALGVIPSLTVEGSDQGRFLLRRGSSRKSPFGAISRLSRGGRANTETQGPILATDGAKMLRGRAWEAYRSLRASLLLSHSGKPPQTIMMTSALPGEGKTTTAANIALAMVQTGARTVVVDLDMRKPALGRTFGITSTEGMSTFLSGNSDLSSQIRKTGLPNLYLLPAGPPAPNPPELLSSPRMAKGLELLKEYFTHIVIDSPPTLELSDALVLSRQVDGVIVVARGGKTPRQALRKASDQLLGIGARILGVLINDVDVRRSEYGYSYYGYHGGYDRYYCESDTSSLMADESGTTN